MPLKVGAREGREGLWITGTVTPAGSTEGVRIRRRAGSDDRRTANEEAAALTAQILRDAYHGPRRGTRSWVEASASYRQFEQRSKGTLDLLARLLRHFRETPLSAIGQAEVDRACRALLRPDASPATRLRNVIVPIKAVLTHAARRGWCDMPHFEAPRQPKSRTPCLLPAEVEGLRQAAPRLAPLITWYVATGCRRGETYLLDWADVDLRGGIARLWPDTTKAGTQRIVRLVPAVVAMLASLPHREGPVFGAVDIKKSLATAARNAEVELRGVHDLRHTWASWHYAIERDLMLLRTEGGWATVQQVETYAHLMPAGHEGEIRRIWGLASNVQSRKMAG